jgi:hypothetical protein
MRLRNPHLTLLQTAAARRYATSSTLARSFTNGALDAWKGEPRCSCPPAYSRSQRLAWFDGYAWATAQNAMLIG